MYNYDGKPREYRIFGLQRSGTYYLEFFIKSNLKIKCGNKGQGELWKHSPSWPTEILLEKETFFPIHKNPYMWCESLIIKNVDYVSRQKMFPAKEIGTSDEMCRGFNVANLARQYEYWYDQWMVSLPNEYKDRTYHVRYEDLLEEDGREKFINDVSSRFNIKRNNVNVINNPNKVTLSDNFTEDKKDKYLNIKTKLLTDANIRIINEVLPDKLFVDMRYRRL